MNALSQLLSAEVGDGPKLHWDDPDLHRKLKFLTNFEAHGNASQAAKAIGTTMLRIERWVKDDEAFANAIRVAMQVAGNMLEAEARRRAVEGCRKYRFDKGRPVYWQPPEGHPDYEIEEIPEGSYGYPGTRVKLAHYYELTYSDGLLTTLLKGAMPEKYGDKVDLTGQVAVKLYDGINTDEIGSRSIKDVPPGGQCEIIDAEYRSGDSVLRPGEDGQVESLPREDSLLLHELAGVPGAATEADAQEPGPVDYSDL